jgi:hypothetical protein
MAPRFSSKHLLLGRYDVLGKNVLFFISFEQASISLIHAYWKPCPGKKEGSGQV